MKVVMLLVVVLFYFAVHDLRIRFVMLFNIHRSWSYVEVQSKRIIRMIFAFSKYFVDFRVINESDRSRALPHRFLLISNHQSLLDIPVLLLAFPDLGLRFVGKKELFRYILLISVVFRIQRHAKIDRSRNFADTMREIERLGRMAARRGCSPAVFPEGTRSRTGALGAFHSGAVRTILRTAPLPVVSVAVDGGYRASSLRLLLTNIEHLRYRVKTLSVYPPPKSKVEIDRILAAARAEISDQLVDWRTGTSTDPSAQPADKSRAVVRRVPTSTGFAENN